VRIGTSEILESFK